MAKKTTTKDKKTPLKPVGGRPTTVEGSSGIKFSRGGKLKKKCK